MLLPSSNNNEIYQHEAEVAQLKCELDTSRKAFSGQMELVAQFRRQQEASELRIKDLKKTILADQCEIKELRLKVQNTAQAKTQLASRQDEVERLRKNLQNLEIKHKTEIQNQHLKLTHQEKTLTAESRRRETLEQLVDNLKSDAEQESHKLKDRICSLQEELDLLTRSFTEAQTLAAEERCHLIHLQATFVRVAEAYGNLAASSVSLDKHRQSELECASLRLRNIRLERRLVDRDALVEQLADYCRQASDEKNLLAENLQELEDDHRTQLSRHYPDDPTHPEDMSLVCSLFNDCCSASQEHDSIIRTDLRFFKVMGSFYEANFNDLLVAYAMACRENMEQDFIAERLVNQCSVLQTEANALQLHNNTAEAELSQKSIQIAEAVAQEQVLNERLQTHQREIRKLEDALEREHRTGERLVRATHQSKKNEERLRLEVDESVSS